MRHTTLALVFSLAAAITITGCSQSDTNTDPRPNTPADGGDTSDATGNGGRGICIDPYHLGIVATHEGNDLVFEGSTAGGSNQLQPYGAGDVVDAEDAIVEFRVPEGFANARLSTDGSEFDTLLYVREACSQIPNGADLAFADDTQRAGSDTAETYSTAYLTGLVPGTVVFVVVDGKVGEGASNGRFRLTISPFTPGASGYPCAIDESGATRCLESSERCSLANVCTQSVAVGAMCDPGGLANTCGADATCVSDPSPVEGDAGSVCATPGTRAGAPCRDSGTECDAPLVCNEQMDAPTCVRVMAADQPCDPNGVSNRCAEGLRCRTVAGTSFCESTATSS